jgi:hypothetical protein
MSNQKQSKAIEGEVYVGSVQVHGTNIATSKEGWISIKDEGLFKFEGHNIKYKLVVVEDLGPCECDTCEPPKKKPDTVNKAFAYNGE